MERGGTKEVNDCMEAVTKLLPLLLPRHRQLL